MKVFEIIMWIIRIPIMPFALSAIAWDRVDESDEPLVKLLYIPLFVAIGATALPCIIYFLLVDGPVSSLYEKTDESQERKSRKW